MKKKPGAVSAAMIDKAVPLPWMIHSETEDGKSYIAQESGPEFVARSVPDANAALIVLAVNSHAELVNALTGLLNTFELNTEDLEDDTRYQIENARIVLRAAGVNEDVGG